MQKKYKRNLLCFPSNNKFFMSSSKSWAALVKLMIYQSRNNIEGALMAVAPPYQPVCSGKLWYNGAFSYFMEAAAWVTNQTSDRKRSRDYHS